MPYSPKSNIQILTQVFGGTARSTAIERLFKAAFSSTSTAESKERAISTSREIVALAQSTLKKEQAQYRDHTYIGKATIVIMEDDVPVVSITLRNDNTVIVTGTEEINGWKICGQS